MNKNIASGFNFIGKKQIRFIGIVCPQRKEKFTFRIEPVDKIKTLRSLKIPLFTFGAQLSGGITKTVFPYQNITFILAVLAAMLTAFYMTRQALLVFFGEARKPGVEHPHESPSRMVIPLFVLAGFAMGLSVISTPFWPWFEEWIGGESAHFNGGAMFNGNSMLLLAVSLTIVIVGVGASYLLYRNVSNDSTADDPMKGKLGAGLWGFLENAMGFDAFYEKAVITPLAKLADGFDFVDRKIFVPLMAAGETVSKAFGRFTGTADQLGPNFIFDEATQGIKHNAKQVSRSQSGRPQGYLRAIGLGMSALLVLYFIIVAIA